MIHEELEGFCVPVHRSLAELIMMGGYTKKHRHYEWHHGSFCGSRRA